MASTQGRSKNEFKSNYLSFKGSSVWGCLQWILFLKRVSCEVQRPWSGAGSPLTLAHCSHQPCAVHFFVHLIFRSLSLFYFSSDLGTVPPPIMCTYFLPQLICLLCSLSFLFFRWPWHSATTNHVHCISFLPHFIFRPIFSLFVLWPWQAPNLIHYHRLF